MFPALQTENSKRTAATGSNNLNVIEMITWYRQKEEHNEIVGVEAIIKIPFWFIVKLLKDVGWWTCILAGRRTGEIFQINLEKIIFKEW